MSVYRTSGCVVSPLGPEDLDIHRLRLRRLSDEQIARYVNADNPVDCAGSYRIEGLGIYTSAVVIADGGRIYFGSEDGTLHIVE